MAAREKNKIAHYRLGVFYAIGKGVEQDYTKAVHHYTIAAELGHIDAAYYLGECLLEGNGCEKDVKRAKHWFQFAADNGHRYAQNILRETYQ